ncbi:riboflavin synthase subunit beta [Poritiphilus flavus]|uniref:Riboflavin synthase subunit beta n=1 Tax=Poritiphilus flavus TaxID=2697053 RepID=A0A6L9E9R1_9FLAO|nr:riboflavin synthase subunit beta [Poritiphilus flavus]NAS11394.1 riboflavin synthase subunit beta [Poritiphilus flavus]
MGRFTKLRKNKKFKYSPRYYDDKGEGNPYKIGHKLDKYRTTVGSQGGIKGRFNNAMADMRVKGDPYLKLRMIIIIAILILIFLYIIDFDISIFFSR